jgi:hypothetical protein
MSWLGEVQVEALALQQPLVDAWVSAIMKLSSEGRAAIT